MVPPTELLAHWQAAEPEVREAGRAWYPGALAVCREIAGDAVPVEAVVRVMALLSPRVSWKWCITWTREMVEAYVAGRPIPAVSTMGNRMKAWSELHGEPALSGQKVTAFAAAILGDTEAVVIDSWVLRSVGLKPESKVTRFRQRWITDAYTQAASLAGETPRDMQAIVWCAIRGAAA